MVRRDAHRRRRGRTAATVATALTLAACLDARPYEIGELDPDQSVVMLVQTRAGSSATVLDVEAIRTGSTRTGPAGEGHAVLLVYRRPLFTWDAPAYLSSLPWWAAETRVQPGELPQVSDPAEGGALPGLDAVGAGALAAVLEAQGPRWAWAAAVVPAWVRELRFAAFRPRCPRIVEEQALDTNQWLEPGEPRVRGVTMLHDRGGGRVLVGLSHVDGTGSLRELTGWTAGAPLLRHTSALTSAAEWEGELWLGDGLGRIHHLSVSPPALGPAEGVDLGRGSVRLGASAGGLLAVSDCACLAKRRRGAPAFSMVEACVPTSCDQDTAGIVPGDAELRVAFAAGGSRVAMDQRPQDVRRIDLESGAESFECWNAQGARNVDVITRAPDGRLLISGTDFRGKQGVYERTGEGTCPWEPRGRIEELGRTIRRLVPREDGLTLYLAQQNWVGPVQGAVDCDPTQLSGPTGNPKVAIPVEPTERGLPRYLLAADDVPILWTVRLD